MIYTHIAYDLDKNLGAAYNRFMNLLGDDDWACFLDHDAMFTTEDWYHQLTELIKKYPDGIFYGIANRTGHKLQLDIEHYDPKYEHDILFHRKVGRTIQEQNRIAVSRMDADDPQLLSGFMILVSKKTWNIVQGVTSGFLGIDNDLHKKCNEAGIPVYIARGVYLYHWYREKI